MTAAVIDERAAGVYDIPEAEYFAARYALSCSGAKLLLPPSCPAKFFWRMDHPEHKKAWDLGSGAHQLVLGTGPELVEVKADDWRTNAAKAERDAARAAGKIPLLSRDVAVVKAMAAALEAHPVAWNLLDPEHGHAEQSLFWTDQRTGVRLGTGRRRHAGSPSSGTAAASPAWSAPPPTCRRPSRATRPSSGRPSPTT
jgi:hypothetical protein